MTTAEPDGTFTFVLCTGEGAFEVRVDDDDDGDIVPAGEVQQDRGDADPCA